MQTARPWRRLLPSLLGAWAAGASGCMPGGYLHPVPSPPPELAAACLSVPPCRRQHVHVFFVNGLDPLYEANLCGTRDYVRSLGFDHTHLGQAYDCLRFEDEPGRGRPAVGPAMAAAVRHRPERRRVGSALRRPRPQRQPGRDAAAGAA